MNEPINNTPAPDAESSKDEAILPRSLMLAVVSVIDALDHHKIHPDDYWRIFKAVRVLCDGLEDNRSSFERGLNAIGEQFKPMLPLLPYLIQGLVERHSTQATEPEIHQGPGIQAQQVACAYILARIENAEIVGVGIYSEETPTSFAGTVYATLAKVYAFDFDTAATQAAKLYRDTYPQLASRFSLPASYYNDGDED